MWCHIVFAFLALLSKLILGCQLSSQSTPAVFHQTIIWISCSFQNISRLRWRKDLYHALYKYWLPTQIYFACLFILMHNKLHFPHSLHILTHSLANYLKYTYHVQPRPTINWSEKALQYSHISLKMNFNIQSNIQCSQNISIFKHYAYTKKLQHPDISCNLLGF